MPGAVVALGFVSLLWLLVSTASATPQALPPTAGFLSADGTVRLGPVTDAQLDALRLAGQDGAPTVLAVHILEDGDREAARRRPAVLGTWRIEEPDLLFEPRFPWVRGQTYLVRWRPPTAAPDQTIHEEVLTIPSSPALSAGASSPATVVHEIYPSTPEVPQNLLKIYLQFSAPMTRGVAHRHLRLWRESQSEGGVDVPVDSPFVAPEHELWNPAGDRLTLLFDPGRLKRGVGPNAAVGPPLQAGQKVRLDVDASWPDASGRPLGRSAQRRWLVQDSDRTVPRPQNWRLTPPAHSEAPLTVHFDEPLDVALLQHALSVHGHDGAALDGEVTIDAQEQRWRFLPREPWDKVCGLQLHVHSVLEDLAGNRTFRRFDEPTPTSSIPSKELPAEAPQRLQSLDLSVPPVVIQVPCLKDPAS